MSALFLAATLSFSNFIGPKDLIQDFIEALLDETVSAQSISFEFFHEYNGEPEFKPTRDSILLQMIESYRKEIIQGGLPDSQIEIASSSERPELFSHIVLGQVTGDAYVILVSNQVSRYVYIEADKIQSMTLMNKGKRSFFLIL